MNFNQKIIDSNNVTLDKLNKKMELIQQTETNNNEKEFSRACCFAIFRTFHLSANLDYGIFA